MPSPTPDRTELEWVYEPSNFFEAPFRYFTGEYSAVIENGKAIVDLHTPQHPVDSQLEHQVQALIVAVFRTRQLDFPRQYELRGPRVQQSFSGRAELQLRASSDALVITGDSADTVIRDAAGNILRDTRAERIAEHTTRLKSVAPKATQSAVLSSMLESHARSLSDTGNALVHLYEVRDALVQYYGGELKARQQLGISDSDWRRVGFLANAEPLEQGRHRGKHPTGRRVATDAELREVRMIVRCWILAFADRI